MNHRDLRINPQHGDSVTVGTETREVESVNGDRVIYSWPHKIAVRTMYMAAWRNWAAQSTHYQAAEAVAA